MESVQGVMGELRLCCVLNVWMEELTFLYVESNHFDFGPNSRGGKIGYVLGVLYVQCVWCCQPHLCFHAA